MFDSFVRTMIHQLETRLVQSEAHFKATELFPARIDFTLSNKQILQRLALIFEPNSPYYDDVVQHGNIDSVHTDIEHWIIHWEENHNRMDQRKLSGSSASIQ